MSKTYISLSCLCLAAGFASIAQAGETADALVARGEYLARAMDCGGCHMPRGADGAPMVEAGLSGGTVGFEIPGMGIFWPPNLTSSETGLGLWTDEQIDEGLRSGVRPDGRVLAPAMPWPSYAALSDEDAAALIAFLRSLPAVDTPPQHPVADASEARGPFYRVTFPDQ